MIFGLVVAFGALDAERREIAAQPRQRTLVQEAGQIIRGVGQQFAAAEPDEQVEELALDALDRGFAGGLRQRGMRDAERRRVAAQAGETLQQLRVRRAREQRGEQRVFLRARRGDLVGLRLVLPGSP